MMYYVLDDNKKAIPATLEEWSAMFEKNDRKIAFDVLGDYEVSTVFLGLDHNYFGGEPLIFETMIFCKDQELDQSCWRYSTYEQALVGHQEALNLVKGKL